MGTWFIDDKISTCYYYAFQCHRIGEELKTGGLLATGATAFKYPNLSEVIKSVTRKKSPSTPRIRTTGHPIPGQAPLLLLQAPWKPLKQESLKIQSLNNYKPYTVYAL